MPNSSLSTLHTEYFLLQTLCLTYFSLDIPHLRMRKTMIIYCCLNILIHLINFVQKSKPSCELEKRGFFAQFRACTKIWFFYETTSKNIRGLPWWLSGKESACQCRRCGFDPWVGKMPWRSKWQPTLVFLLGEFHGQRCLEGYSPWGLKESDTT